MPEQAPEPAAKPAAGTIPHWSHGDDDPLTIVDGDGVTVTDDEGRTYLDFIAQLYCVNAGHGEERIADAIAAQASKVAYVASAKHNDARSELAGRLAARIEALDDPLLRDDGPITVEVRYVAVDVGTSTDRTAAAANVDPSSPSPASGRVSTRQTA